MMCVNNKIEYVIINVRGETLRSYGTDLGAAIEFMSQEEWKDSTLKIMKKITTYKEVPFNG